MPTDTGLDEIGLEMKRAANSRLRGDADKDALLREAWLELGYIYHKSHGARRERIKPLLDKIKTALGDV